MTRRTALRSLSFFPFAGALGATWPQWRGPNRDGISPEKGLLGKWPAGGPERIWTAQGLGEGFASFSAADGKVFTQGQRGGRQYVIAIDQRTGQRAWETENGGAYQDSRGGGPRGTPTIDGDRLYAIGANGNLICLRLADGSRIWQLGLLSEFRASNIRWGISESPLVDGDKIVVNPGGRNASLVALNKADGSVIWKSQSDKAGYSSAVRADIGGLAHYIFLTGEAAAGVRADNGELLWRYPKVSNSTANIATPVVSGNRVFVSSDYGTGGALLELKRTNGGITAEEVYFNRDMRNHYSSCVLADGYLYGFSSRILTCMKFDTGEIAWRDRSVGKGQVILAEGKLYLLSEDGVAGLAEAAPEGYREISRFEIGRGNYPTWTLPVIADGRLYLRDQDQLYCYDVRAA